MVRYDTQSELQLQRLTNAEEHRATTTQNKPRFHTHTNTRAVNVFVFDCPIVHSIAIFCFALYFYSNIIFKQHCIHIRHVITWSNTQKRRTFVFNLFVCVFVCVWCVCGVCVVCVWCVCGVVTCDNQCVANTSTHLCCLLRNYFRTNDRRQINF